MASAGIRRNVFFTLKATFGIALLVLIVSRMDLRELTDLVRSASLGYVAVAILLQVLAKVIWTARWQAVLKLNDVQRGFWMLFGLVHIGLFFNNFLPSSVGGDAVRGYYASSESGLAKSYGAVIIERIVGVISLALMSAIAVMYATWTGAWQSSNLLLLLGGAGSLIFFFLGASLLFWDGWQVLLQYVAKLIPKGARVLADLAASLKIFRAADRSGSMLVIVSSIGLQIVAVLFYVACARSLGIATATVMFFVIIPISVVIAMLPISLNGLGVREAALITMFVAQGAAATPVSAFALLALAISTAFGLFGGILYIFWRPVRAASG